MPNKIKCPGCGAAIDLQTLATEFPPPDEIPASPGDGTDEPDDELPDDDESERRGNRFFS